MADAGYYMVELAVTPEGGAMPGSPNLTLKLGVNSNNGEINGQATSTQAVAPPDGEQTFPVSGTIHHTGLGEDTLLVALSGKCARSLPPPAIGTYFVRFSAALAVDKGWNGTGSYTFGNIRMSRCKVTKTSS
ncbi:MAG: DUF1842 domain-containing protein [Erythrobacter sp.]